MKKTVTMLALMLIWIGTANASELKVQIPVTDYEQIQSRLDALENENSRLKQEVRTLESNSADLAAQPVMSAEPSEEMLSKLSELERENNQLKQEVESLQNSPDTSGASDDIESRLSSLESENIQLSQKIKSYKEQGVRVIDNDRRSARHVYRDMKIK